MKPLKVGSIIQDSDGTKGRVLKIEHIPSIGRGYAARDEIYVQWLIPDVPDETPPSQKKHG